MLATLRDLHSQGTKKWYKSRYIKNNVNAIVAGQQHGEKINDLGENSFDVKS